MVKSEPASRLDESLDGAQDSDITAVSSGEGQPLLQSSMVSGHLFCNSGWDLLTVNSNVVESRLQVTHLLALLILAALVLSVLAIGD
jgi:hypothetical protein